MGFSGSIWSSCGLLWGFFDLVASTFGKFIGIIRCRQFSREDCGWKKDQWWPREAAIPLRISATQEHYPWDSMPFWKKTFLWFDCRGWTRRQNRRGLGTRARASRGHLVWLLLKSDRSSSGNKIHSSFPVKFLLSKCGSSVQCELRFFCSNLFDIRLGIWIGSRSVMQSWGLFQISSSGWTATSTPIETTPEIHRGGPTCRSMDERSQLLAGHTHRNATPVSTHEDCNWLREAVRTYWGAQKSKHLIIAALFCFLSIYFSLLYKRDFMNPVVNVSVAFL